MRRLAPVAEGGPRSGAALPLAGMRDVWFDRLVDPGTGDFVPAGALDAAQQAALSAERPALFGLRLDAPLVMGILNVTPDSFSDGGDLARIEDVVARAQSMAGEADILDIGGESTRPGAPELPVADEIARVVPAIRAIREAGLATPISIDTRKAAVADAALEAGADMVNDVSALGFDPDMAAVVAGAGVPVCLMHSVGTPETMQAQARYADVLGEVFDSLAASIERAVSAGIGRDRIIADPGIGFGKTLQHNVTILRHLSVYHGLGCALLLGASRKRFIGTLGAAPEAKDRTSGSVAVALHGARQGAHILRVHDTMETRQALTLQQALIGTGHYGA